MVYFCQPEGCVSGSRRTGAAAAVRDATSFVFTLTDKGKLKASPESNILLISLQFRFGQDALRHLRQLLSAGGESIVRPQWLVEQSQGEVVELPSRVVAQEHGEELRLSVLQRPSECR